MAEEGHAEIVSPQPHQKLSHQQNSPAQDSKKESTQIEILVGREGVGKGESSAGHEP